MTTGNVSPTHYIRSSSFAVITRYDVREIIGTKTVEFNDNGGSGEAAFEDGTWSVRIESKPVESAPDALDVFLHFKLESGASAQTSLGFQMDVFNWSRDHYVLMPATAYNGNRFIIQKQEYPPMYREEDARLDMPVIITDVAHLNIEDGPSRLQQPSHDMATPALGVFDPSTQSGLFLLTEQKSHLGDYSYIVEESDDRTRATLTITAPSVRQGQRLWAPWQDRAPDWNAGDEFTLHVRVHRFSCADIPALFERFMDVRQSLVHATLCPPEVPFSKGIETIVDKYNLSNWNEEFGFYSDGVGAKTWQLGWVGSTVTMFGLLAHGDDLARERVRRSLDWAFNSQTECGLLRGFFKIDDTANGQWIGDGFDRPYAAKWLLMRKDADALYFIMKMLLLMQSRPALGPVEERWRTGIRRLADAFVTLWRRYGQLGHFVNEETGEIVVGGSTCAAAAPGGLVLAAQFFNVPEYAQVAQEIADNYYNKWTRAGVTTGGPGEILQCPDSESAFALLESLVVLRDHTGDERWAKMASDMANQCASWTVSYDFEFPSDSTLGVLKTHAAGSVFANVQNKHSAPAICTFSGDSLFKLFRATGDRRYLELIRDIARGATQYMSREDKPITGMPPGWMCERVNLSDWEGTEKVGYVPPWSTWAETGTLLSQLELPGIYYQPDTGLTMLFDHVKAKVVESSPASVTLEVNNPTKFPASVLVLCEYSKNNTTPLPFDWQKTCPRLSIPAGKNRTITVAI